MKLSVSCPSCGKTFRNIKPEMAGKKARCGCGTVVRLEKPDGPRPTPKPNSQNQEPVDLLDVDLLGDEMLGSQLLFGDLPQPNSTPRPTAGQPPVRAEPILPNQVVAIPKRTQSTPAKSRATKIRRGPTANVKPEPALNPPRTKAKTKPNRSPRPGSSPKSTSRRTPAPEVPLTVSVSKSSKANSQRPLFDQTYSDLDDILAGAGDASPLMARPRPDAPTQPWSGSVSSNTESNERKSSTFGFLAALGSATLAFWFGLFVAASRFQIIDWFLLSGLSTHLRSVFQVSFSASEVPPTYQILFVTLGWLLWSVAVAMIMMAIGQIINAFVKLLSERQPFRWADGLSAALGVSAVFLLVAMVFCQSSFAKQEHINLDVFEQPFVEEGERLENLSQYRAAIDQRNRSFTTSMLVGATIPMSIFVFSMVRLFAKSTEES